MRFYGYSATTVSLLLESGARLGHKHPPPHCLLESGRVEHMAGYWYVRMSSLSLLY